MIFQTPDLDDVELAAIARIDHLRTEVSHLVAQPRRWLGSLRRQLFARAVQGSNSIEGYDALLDDVMAAIDGEEALDAEAETVQALQGYRDAMTCVLQLAEDDLPIDETLLRSLHFMMLKYDLRKSPGRWRPGSIFVLRESDGAIVYEGPDALTVPTLIGEMLAALRVDQSPVVVRAAMAHLNLVMIHPFRDGNGRMARCLQTLVLAREKILAPTFSSIEEYLGRNTLAYYNVLGQVGQGAWHPEHNARPWMRFCLDAHYRQALTLLRRVKESELLWDACWHLVREKGLPERSIPVLFDAARRLRVRNASYRTAVRQSFGEELSEQVASRDLRALVDGGLLEPQGETRGRHYIATSTLLEAWGKIRQARPKELAVATLFDSEVQLQFRISG